MTPVGHLCPPPARVAAAGALLAIAGALAVTTAAGHRPLPTATFEFGTVRSFQGLVTADPYPSLLVRRGSVASRYLLVGPGKSGADALVAEAVGGPATLRGSLVFRDGQAAVQVEPGSVVPLNEPAPAPDPPEDLGSVYLEGEIVGAKCHFGVMNPGSGIVHRACARLCIRGGVPPLLAVRLEDGRTEGLLLTGPQGEAVGEALGGLVGVPVGVRGRLIRKGPAAFVQVDPREMRRLR